MTVNEQYREAMGKALFLANRARETGDVPVGAVVVDAEATSSAEDGTAARPTTIPQVTPKSSPCAKPAEPSAPGA